MTKQTKSRWSRAISRLALVVTVAAIAAACGGGGSDDDSAPTTTRQIAEEVIAESASTSTTAPAPAPDAGFVADASVLQAEFSPLEPGTYRVDTLGIPMSVTLEGDWMVQPNSFAFTVFTDPSSSGPGDQDVVFQRVSGLIDPADPTRIPDDGWPLDDLDGWLENVIDGVVVGSPRTETIGGREATVFDVEIEDSDLCGPEFCIGFTTNEFVNSQTFMPGIKYRVHWFDLGDVAPLIVVIGWSDATADFEARATALLASVAFGEPGENPIPTGADLVEIGAGGPAGPGIVELPVVDGLRLELSEQRDIFFFTGVAAVQLGFDPGDVEILRPVADTHGEPVASVDEIVAAIEEMNAEVTEIEPAVHPLGTARVFDLEGDGMPFGFDGLRAEPEAATGWRPPAKGRLWLFETERGVIMVTAEQFDANSDVFEAALALAEEILPSLELASEPDGVPAMAMSEVQLNGDDIEDGKLLAPGIYTTDLIGNDLLVALRTSTDLVLLDELSGLFAVGAPGIELGHNEGLAVFTATGVAAADLDSGPQPFPADLGAHLEASTSIEVLASGESSAGSVQSRWWDLTAVAEHANVEGCPFGECVALFTHDLIGTIVVGDEWSFRLWEIPDPDGTVYALMQVDQTRFEAFADAAEQALSGLRILPLVAPAEVDESSLDSRGRSSSPDDAQLEPGVYTSDALPASMTVELAEPFTLGFVTGGFVELLPAEVDSTYTAVAFIDPNGAVADPADIGGPEGPPRTIPMPEDLESWIDEIPQIEVSASGTGVVGGIESHYVDLRVTGAPERRGSCGPDACFVLFDWTSGPWLLAEGAPQRLWLVPHPAGAILVAIETSEERFDGWVAQTEALLDSVSFD